MRRRIIRGNPLRNPSILKKLNPHSAVLKKYARITNEKRRLARQVLIRKRSGAKVNESELKKATATLGVKAVRAKEYRAELKKKAAAIKATAAKVQTAVKKRTEKKKANAENARKEAAKKAASKKKK